MLEFRLDLRLGQGQNNTRLSIIILGQHPTGQQSHNSFGTLLRILPLPLTCFPSASLSLQAQGRILPSVSWQNTLCSLQGTGSQARAKGTAALPQWVSSKGAWESHGQRSLVGHGPGVAKSQTGLSDWPGTGGESTAQTNWRYHCWPRQSSRGQRAASAVEGGRWKPRKVPTITGQDWPALGK